MTKRKGSRSSHACFGRIVEPDEKTPPPGFSWPTVVRGPKPQYTEAAMKALVQGKVEMH
jgi:hypothetical protein